MLFRQHLRRRDEHRLFAGADGLHHSRHRDHGFAGADLALQQALHGVITCHIVGNIGDHLLLPVRQRERQRLDEIVFQPRVGAGCGRGLTRRIARLHQRSLADERFLVAQCTQRLVETVAVLRIVNRHERFGSVHQPMFHTKRFRHDVGNGGGKRFRPCLPVGLRRVEFPMLRVAGIGAMQCTGCLCRSVFVTAQPVHAFFDRLVDVFAGDARVRVVDGTWAAYVAHRLRYGSRIVFEIRHGRRLRDCRRLFRAEAVIPFGGFLR